MVAQHRHFAFAFGAFIVLLTALGAASCGRGGIGASQSVGGETASGLLRHGEVPVAQVERSVEAVVAEIEAAASPQGVDPAVFEQLRSALIQAIRSRSSTKVSSGAPQGLSSQVQVLAPLFVAGGLQFFWEEVNCGDYDRNGEVNIADLTVIGLNFGKSAASEDWTAARAADGDGNGEINLADITPVGVNFGAQIGGYSVYRSLSGGSAPELAGSVSRTQALHADDETVLYSFIEPTVLEIGQTYVYEVRPFCPGSQAEEGVASLPLEITYGDSFGQHVSPVVLESIELEGIVRNVISQELLITFNAEPSTEELFAVLYNELALDLLGQIPGTYTYRVAVQAGDGGISAELDRLNAAANGRFLAEYDFAVLQEEEDVPAPRGVRFTYADPQRAIMWGLDEVHANEGWDYARGGGITVAVIDSGLETSHEDIGGQYLTGIRYGGSDAWSDDTSTHGTHVAGTIGAAGGNAKGIVGLAPDCDILPIRAGFPYNGSWGFGSSDLTSSVNYAVSHGARVINMSLGGQGTLGSAFENALTAAENAGVVVVAAAGNSNMDVASFYPASYPTVFSVGAVGPSLARAGYSNYGSGVDICAPGGDIVTAWEQGILSLDAANPTNYSYKQGTSMACPHAAAMCALVLSANPGLTPAQVRSVIQGTGRTVAGTGGSKPVGKLIDAQAAMASVATFSVSGTVKRSDNTGVSGISLTLSDGTSSYSATSGTGGAFNITGVENGDYTLTPVRAGWTFSPATVSVMVSSGSVSGQAFVGSQDGLTETENNDTYQTAYFLPDFPFESSQAGGSLGSAAGYIAYDGDAVDFYKFTVAQPSRLLLTLAYDASKGNLNMALLSTNGTTQLKATTGSAGSKSLDYTFAAAGTYYLRCFRSSGYGDYSLAGSLTPAYGVGGTVTLVGGAPLAGAAVTLAGAGITYTGKTVAGGVFSVPNAAEGEYTLTITAVGRTFTPASRSVTISGGAVSGQDFVGEGPFLVGGTVTMVGGTPLASCLLTLGNGVKQYTALSGATGIYSIKGVPNGTYTLTPSSTGRTFTPASLEVTVASGNLTGQNFVGEGPFTVAGKVTQVGGANLSGATLTLAGGGKSYIAKSGSTGTFTVTGVPNGSYVLTPSMAGRTFTPVSSEVTVSSGNVTGKDFVGEGPFTVGGTVLDQTTNLPLASVKLALSGGMGTYIASTNTLGVFSVKGVPNGSYTLTPTRAAYGFSAAQSITVASGNVTGADFSGFKVFSVGGRVTNGSAGVAGITITVSDGSTTRTATTNPTGYYTVTGVPAGTFTVTPSGGGGSFTPASRPVTLVAANITAINFTSP